MSYEAIVIEHNNGVDYVTLNRPNELNALSPQMVTELRDYFGELAFNQKVRIVVLKGAGRAFCAGLDLKGSLDVDTVEPALRSQREVSEIMIRMRRCPQPIISLLKGPVCGGGFAMALASDIRIAGESAKMNAAFMKLGLSGCDVGVSYHLPRLVGSAIASELLLTGRFIYADRALRVGLVSDVVTDDALEEAGEVFVKEMLATSAVGLRLTKEALNMNADAPSLESAIAMEDRNQVVCLQGEDFRKQLDAFLTKSST
ncbi:enoyl-CoA hydratase/isomerase family protein [Maricurvus nonylphenolicus]|uniref:enoyl-CoA hydratase/isomerase family protein n=1 Tax=Maricurvus nonylphenolicus TaxID=1008307 RepID=UPI0036F40206